MQIVSAAKNSRDQMATVLQFFQVICLPLEHICVYKGCPTKLRSRRVNDVPAYMASVPGRCVTHCTLRFALASDGQGKHVSG